MTKGLSIYLDFIRFFAAFLVFLFHSNSYYHVDSKFFVFGHEAVIVFFVLSGFVIAFVSEQKEKTPKAYFIARAARIYSVAVPAILITIVLDCGGNLINHVAYPEGYQTWDLIPVRLGSSVLFLNEIWFLSIQLFSNVPYWSLNYEVWYYLLFGILFYSQKKIRWAVFALACLFIGPKILLLMPIWWLGVYIYKSERLKRITEPQGWVLFLTSIIGIMVYVEYHIGSWAWDYFDKLVGAETYKYLTFSRQFLTDYLLGLVVAAQIVGFRAIASRFNTILAVTERPVRYLASLTFSLYLFHQPLLLFYDSIFYAKPQTPANYAFILLCSFASVMVLATFTEHKKHVWKRWIVRGVALAEDVIDREFGTVRGLARTAIDNLMWIGGAYRKFGHVDWARVKRVVFVCQGNICRSPFAHRLAETLTDAFPVASFGLATTTGTEAFPTAQATASRHGVDLSGHKAVASPDFPIRDGDLLVAMEYRHIGALRPLIDGREVQVALLGLWCRPRFALLYDPHTLSLEYFTTCFSRIERAVRRLVLDAETTTPQPAVTFTSMEPLHPVTPPDRPTAI